MEAAELRQFTADELKGRIKQWQDELFRARFKGQTSEAKDTSVVKKLRHDIARANTVLVEKTKNIVLPPSAMVVKTKPKKMKAKGAEDKAEKAEKVSKEKDLEGKKTSKKKA
jgi:large subunit ribosomal protein L29